MGYSPWGPKVSDRTERLHFHSSPGILRPPWGVLSCVVGVGGDGLKGSNCVTNNFIWLRPAGDNVYIFQRVCPSVQVWGIPGGCLV